MLMLLKSAVLRNPAVTAAQRLRGDGGHNFFSIAGAGGHLRCPGHPNPGLVTLTLARHSAIMVASPLAVLPRHLLRVPHALVVVSSIACP